MPSPINVTPCLLPLPSADRPCRLISAPMVLIFAARKMYITGLVNISGESPPSALMESSRPVAFNPLRHPVCLGQPLRLAATAWASHAPFAMYLVSALGPRVVVELGTFGGVSYCAFCQAVRETGLAARCF